MQFASIATMTMLTIRNLDENVKARLRRRAAENSRSMEAEARALLAAALSNSAPAKRSTTASSIARFRKAIRGLEVDLAMPKRSKAKSTPSFE